MPMFKDFKAFILRGNVMDLAVGVIIGGALASCDAPAGCVTLSTAISCGDIIDQPSSAGGGGCGRGTVPGFGVGFGAG